MDGMQPLRKELRSPSLLAVVLAAALVSGTLSCGQTPVAEADLPGAYHASHSYGVERLDLRENGTFEQAFEASDGRVLRASGTWRYWRREGGALWLDRAFVVDDGFGRAEPSPRRMRFQLTPRRVGSRIHLRFNPDLPVEFERD